MSTLENASNSYTKPEFAENEDFNPLTMYEVSGYPQPHEIIRHYEQSRRFDSAIQELADNDVLHYKTALTKCSPDDKADLIKKGLIYHSQTTSRIALEALGELPVAESVAVVKELLLQLTDADLISKLIDFSSDNFKNEFEEHITAITMEAKVRLASDSKILQESGETLLDILPQTVVQEIFLENFRKYRAGLILYVDDKETQDEMADIYTNWLLNMWDSISATEQQKAINSLIYYPSQYKHLVSHKALLSENTVVQLSAVRLFSDYDYANDDSLTAKVVPLLETALQSSDTYYQELALIAMRSLPASNIEDLVQLVLECGSLEMQRTAVDYLKITTDNYDQYYPLLSNKDAKLAERARASFFSSNIVDKEKLFDELIASSTSEQLVLPDYIYRNTTDNEVFSRVKERGRNSNITFFNGSLATRVVQRTYTPESFLVWQDAYEDFEAWKNGGLDYVPIEPIVSYQSNKNGQINVFSTALDLSIDELTHMTHRYSNHFAELLKKIFSVLRNKNIEHNDIYDELNSNNVVVRFFRDETGKIDYATPPRLYVIDFEEALYGE